MLKSKKTLTVASLNLGFNVMSNNVKGTEGVFVNLCQLKYPKYNGWLSNNKDISVATFNSALFLSDYDLFGLQEVNLDFQKPFQDKIKDFGLLKGKNYKFISSMYFDKWLVTIGYDEIKMGKMIPITPNGFKIGEKQKRGMQAVYFPYHQLLFINLHAPHNINLIKELKEKCSNIMNRFIEIFGNINIINRILMSGDFNDDQEVLLKTPITIFNKKLGIPGYVNYIPRTCCEDSGFIYFGDYILDSNYTNDNIYFGLPLNYNSDIHLFSDHDPVVLIENNYII
jgi:hypothetical protein